MDPTVGSRSSSAERRLNRCCHDRMIISISASLFLSFFIHSARPWRGHMICLRPSDVSEWGAWPMPKEQETFRLPSRSIVECFSALFAGCRSRDHPSEPPTHRHHRRRRIQWIRPVPFSSRTEYFDPTPHVQRPQRVRRVVGENCPRAERLIGLRDYCLGSRWS